MPTISDVCDVQTPSATVLMGTLKPNIAGCICDCDGVTVTSGPDGQPVYSRRGTCLDDDEICRGTRHLGERLLSTELPIEKLRIHKHVVYADLSSREAFSPDLQLTFQRAVYAASRFTRPKDESEGRSRILNERPIWGR